LNLSSVSSTAEGLLDIESSINKEMEASVLLGRQVNLSKAREYALMGDIDNMTRSLVEQVGSINEFNRLNIIQRQALAEAIGMSVDDLSKMINRQDELNKQTGKYSKLLEGVKLATGGIGKLFTKDNLMFASSMSLLLKNIGPGLSGLLSRLPKLNLGLKKLTDSTTTLSKANITPGTNIISQIGGQATNMLKGAGAMAIVAGSLWILSKAIQQFAKID